MTTQTLRNQINRRLSSLPTYVEQIPLAQIFSFFQDYGLTVVAEDGSPWSGFLCGAEGRATFQVAGSKIVLYVSWYTMPSGRYELTTYASQVPARRPPPRPYPAGLFIGSAGEG